MQLRRLLSVGGTAAQESIAGVLALIDGLGADSPSLIVAMEQMKKGESKVEVLMEQLGSQVLSASAILAEGGLDKDLITLLKVKTALELGVEINLGSGSEMTASLSVIDEAEAGNLWKALDAHSLSPNEGSANLGPGVDWNGKGIRKVQKALVSRPLE